MSFVKNGLDRNQQKNNFHSYYITAQMGRKTQRNRNHD
jgi:hypothetical protein